MRPAEVGVIAFALTRTRLTLWLAEIVVVPKSKSALACPTIDVDLEKKVESLSSLVAAFSVGEPPEIVNKEAPEAVALGRTVVTAIVILFYRSVLCQ